MSLATRCPACGTIFRVVQDQLKVSEGWVRCGQCHEVFHGIESLFDLESDPALAARRAARQAGPNPSTAAARQARSERAAFASAPTAPVPFASPPPAASPAAATPRVATAPRTPSPFPAAPVPTPEGVSDPGLASGFAPAAGGSPSVPAMPRGMAPRFAARLAEAARAKPPVPPASAASTFPASASTDESPASSLPSAAAEPSAFAPSAPAPFGFPARTEASRQAPAFLAADDTALPEAAESPPSFDAATEPMPLLDVADREHVDIALVDESLEVPEAPEAPEAPEEPEPVPEPSSPDDDRAREGAAAFFAEAEDLAQLPGDDEAIEQATGHATPSATASRADADERAQEAAEEDEDEALRAGPPTLASMLPEPAAGWPPRSRRDRKRSTKKDDIGAEPEEPVLESTFARDHPRFVREARRGERWSRPWVRATLGATLAVLVIAAVGQVTYPMRDTIASRWPATAPLWATVCDAVGCTVDAPRALGSLSLDGSSLTRTDVDHVLLFSADLHNRSGHAVRMPSFDLSFMDLNGQVVARKVLDPSQIGIRQEALGPEGELHVHARIQVAGLDASGFQAEMFYP